MTLPRLRADLADARAVARVLRGALRHEVASVPLASAPTAPGQHLLEVDVDGEGLVTLLADPQGAMTDEGQPLQLRPVTRPQMAVLLALIERLDDAPSTTVPPPSDGPISDLDAVMISDATLFEPPRRFPEVFDSEAPVPLAAVASGPKISVKPGSLRPRASRPPSSPPAGPAIAPAVPASELLGRVIAGKYRLDSAIGSGMTSAVFKARHLDLLRDVAVKILHAQKLGDIQFVRRFKGEALAASKLEHPNVARVVDFGQEPDGLLYLVMELLTGRSLEAILAASGALPARVAVTFAVHACSALAFAHDIGIVHRDVKPENIMIVPHRDDDGNPCDLAKVCDFGLAKLHDRGGDNEELTTAGMLCGSPAYMSPEQTRGEPLDGRSDIYSLGVTLFESLTGEMPHEANDLAELFTKKMLEPARRLSALLPNVDPLLEDVVARAMHTDPRQRHANARVLREELREVLKALARDSERVDRTIIAD
jgi:serine/threonine-protein kinase